MIERAATPIDDSGVEDAIDLLEEAETLQEEAWEAFEDGDYELAITKTNQARNLVQRAMRMIHADDYAARVEAFLDETDAELEEHSATIEDSGNDEAIEMLADAETLQEEAWEAFDSDDYRLALAKSQQARRLIHRALRLIEL
jgi:HEPN domain-containing protein